MGIIAPTKGAAVRKRYVRKYFELELFPGTHRES